MVSTQQTAGGPPAHPYRVILCPVEFDETSLAALRHARALADAAGATLHLLHVVPIIPTVSEVVSDLEPGGEASAQQRLRDLAERELPGAKFELHTRVALSSDIARHILAAARELDADLIVIATHGRSGLAHFLLGSVTEAVVRNASCPVLTVRP
ncbi:MAG TPA: universal stress protein [Candidatus Binataceae bacterium]|jgi:universal stress protein A|nr:universal stress protein [Candidatus Binataceae bacterium]